MTKRKAVRPYATKARGKPAMKDMPSFEKSAKKFKPGPVAPPESPGARPDMAGAPPTTPTGQVAKQVINDPARGRMTDGKPGQLKKMPGE